MTPPISERSIDALVHGLIREIDFYAQAVRREDVQTSNRHVPNITAHVEALAARQPDGRAILEKSLAHQSAYVRLIVAGRVLQWAPEKAIPVLGRLLFEHLGNDSSADERIDIRTEAKGWLYQHFNIRSFDRNDLIEPLRAYGVELPYRDHEAWR